MHPCPYLPLPCIRVQPALQLQSQGRAPALPGMLNHGNTCYLNATLQVKGGRCWHAERRQGGGTCLRSMSVGMGLAINS